MRFALLAMLVPGLAAQTYLLSTIAGTTGGFGDGGPASQARIYRVTGLAADISGNVYVVDTARVRKISANGIINTVAGIGLPGVAGDGGPATAAITNPSSIATDGAGTLYLVENTTARIRRVTPDGIINEFVGTGVPGYSGDGGPATLAQIGAGTSVAADASGNLYILDPANMALRQVTPGGIISTLATISFPYGSHGIAVGASGTVYVVGGGPQSQITEVSHGQQSTLTLKPQSALIASSPFAFSPASIAVGPGGALYATDPAGRIATIAPDGTASLLAGVPGADFIAADGSGAVYVATDLYSGTLQRVAPDGTVSTVAGAGVGDGGPANEAFIDGANLATDSAGNIYIADYGNSRVRKISTAGIVSTIAGTGVSGYSGDGGIATAAQVSTYLGGIAVDPAGNIYFSDNNRLRKISGGIISTVAGTGVSGNSGDGGPATQAQVSPGDLAFDKSGNLYISDGQNQVVRKLSANGIISAVAGTGGEGFAGDGGPATKAQFQSPGGLALDAAGNLFIADTASNNIRKVDTSGIITTVASDVGGPTGLVFDSSGNLYIAAVTGYVILKMAPGGTPQVIAGTGVSGVAGDEGPALQGQLAKPIGVALSPTGDLLFMDFFGGGSFVRELSSANIFPLLVVNAASQLHAFPSAGELVSIYWSGIGTQTAASATQVLFDGIAAPILFANANQANVLLPPSLAGHAATNLTVKSNGIVSNTVALPLREADPGVFTISGTGGGQGAILNQDNSLNSSTHPAQAGSVIQIFGTGAGTGLSTSVNIGGITAVVQYSGPAPGIPGVFQVNAMVPLSLMTQAAPLTLTFAGAATQSGVTVAVTK